MGVAVDESSDESETVAQVESSHAPQLLSVSGEGEEVILLRFLLRRRRLRLFCSVSISGTSISMI